MIINFLIPILFPIFLFFTKEEPHTVHFMGHQKIEPSEKIINIDSINDPSKFYNVDTNLIKIYYNIQSEFDKPLQIMWGYRDPKTNREIGGAKRSAHLQGKALDLFLPNSDREDIKKLIKLATKYNVLGIGVYRDARTFHIDIDESKGRRAWGSNYSSNTIPNWAKLEVNNHLNIQPIKPVKTSVVIPSDSIKSQIKKSEVKVLEKKTEKVNQKKVIYHTIKKGDTLYSLAKNNDTTVDSICRLNKISNSSSIMIGSRIRIK